MGGDDSERVEVVEVGVHRHACVDGLAVIAGARKRREDEERGLIDEQFVAQGPYVLHDPVVGVMREADDEADVAEDARFVPGGNQIAVAVHLVLPFAGRLQIVVPQRLHADEHLDAPSAGRFLDEPRNARRLRVHLHHEVDGHALALAKLDQAVEDRLPLRIAREVVVREEVVVDAAPPVDAVVRPDVVDDVRGARGCASSGPAR